jgi:hypothetical protein
MEASYDGPKTGINNVQILERSAAVRAAGKEERGRVVDRVIALLLDGHADAGS